MTTKLFKTFLLGLIVLLSLIPSVYITDLLFPINLLLLVGLLFLVIFNSGMQTEIIKRISEVCLVSLILNLSRSYILFSNGKIKFSYIYSWILEQKVAFVFLMIIFAILFFLNTREMNSDCKLNIKDVDYMILSKAVKFVTETSLKVIICSFLFVIIYAVFFRKMEFIFVLQFLFSMWNYLLLVFFIPINLLRFILSKNKVIMNSYNK